MKDPKCDVCKTPVDLSTGPFVCDNCHMRRPAPFVEKSQSVWDLLRATWKTGRLLPTDSAARKQFPLATGVDDYIPAALVCFAALSKVGNDKHNPGEPLHHARDKSSDHPDCLRRHQLDAGDPAADELEEAVCAFWRAGMRVQLLAEKLGAPKAPGAR